MVLGRLMELKTDKSPGPDGLHPRVLEEMALEIVDASMLTVGRCRRQADINSQAVACLLGTAETSPDVVQLLRGHILFQDLGNAGLHFIPPAVLRLQYLEELHLEGNQIEEIPAEIGSLRRLRVLYLNNNSLSRICDQLVECQNLQSLDLSNNPLDCGIPTQVLCHLQALQELRLSNLNLVQLPAQICKKLHHLQLLGLSGNSLTTLPCEIRNLTQLQQLHLKSNKLHGLPPGFCQLLKLEVLNLRQNLLNCLPDDIGSLKNLKHLYLSHNKLTTMPESLDKCLSMCVLDISGNRLHANVKALPASLTELAVSDNQLHIFPTAICNLADSLQLLYLKNIQLKKLSYCFSNLTEIRFLDLSQNLFRYFPKQICDLSHLEMLSLDDNKLKEVAAEIRNLTKLKILGLTGNRFRTFPQEICFIDSLEKLYLGQDHGIKLIHVPEEITHLVKLKELYLENNEIEFLPSTIGLLQNLTVLDCHENRLLEIPDSISDIQEITLCKSNLVFWYRPVSPALNATDLVFNRRRTSLLIHSIHQSKN
ncbi:leucine-rich repeat and IQ domain-containing protein 4-like isoform X3 [Hypanus sabinus]|uniref:leucine-rich repeat and IQ domain-containing protein 4-like isoform X3 n=1 Tax=Hypanus sabinus TaxID=79690 RepID=UPI0028C48A25|nr:leucine-rich repeat and IQ domain-containing protein 4-like isoform X3 [Hypanus sabinus]